MVNIDELIEQRKKDPAWELNIARRVFTARKKAYRKRGIITVTLCSLLLTAGYGAFFAANRGDSLQNNLDSVLSETLPHYAQGAVISKDIDSKIEQYCMAVGE